MLRSFFRAFNRTSMELKHLKEIQVVVGALTFNRTSMELKLDRVEVQGWRRETFNRTSMELKPMSTLCSKTFWTLLIEPVWN